jgi:hypothetical protein
MIKQPEYLDLEEFGLETGQIVMINGERGRYKVLSAARTPSTPATTSAWINLFGGIKGREKMRSVDPARIKKIKVTSRRKKTNNVRS